MFLYSITLDAVHDTPEVLAEYAGRYGVRAGWIFLTGDYEEIEELRRILGVYDLDPVIDADRTQHAGLLVYGNDVLGRWSSLPSLDKPRNIVRALLHVLPRKEG